MPTVTPVLARAFKLKAELLLRLGQKPYSPLTATEGKEGRPPHAVPSLGISENPAHVRSMLSKGSRTNRPAPQQFSEAPDAAPTTVQLYLGGLASARPGLKFLKLDLSRAAHEVETPQRAKRVIPRGSTLKGLPKAVHISRIPCVRFLKGFRKPQALLPTLRSQGGITSRRWQGGGRRPRAAGGRTGTRHNKKLSCMRVQPGFPVHMRPAQPRLEWQVRNQQVDAPGPQRTSSGAGRGIKAVRPIADDEGRPDIKVNQLEVEVPADQRACTRRIRSPLGKA